MSDTENMPEDGGGVPCVSCGKPSNTSTPDDASMCWECFGGFNAACYDELKAKHEWSPIETAPRDGSRILLCMASFVPAIGFFGNGIWVTDEDREIWAQESNDGDLAAYKDYDPSTEWKPTHWMPLPQPPEEI